MVLIRSLIVSLTGCPVSHRLRVSPVSDDLGFWIKSRIKWSNLGLSLFKWLSGREWTLTFFLIILQTHKSELSRAYISRDFLWGCKRVHIFHINRQTLMDCNHALLNVARTLAVMCSLQKTGARSPRKWRYVTMPIITKTVSHLQLHLNFKCLPSHSSRMWPAKVTVISKICALHLATLACMSFIRPSHLNCHQSAGFHANFLAAHDTSWYRRRTLRMNDLVS